MGYKIAILGTENSLDNELWIKACDKNSQISSYDIIDITSDEWYEKSMSFKYDLFLLRPPGRTELFKRLYDERIWLIDNYSDIPIYPSLNEIFIYENKRFLRDWLTIHQLPHPKTSVFFNKEEANLFLDNKEKFPLVGKTNIGASGNGVVILNDRNEVKKYITKAFSSGIKPKIGPKLTKGSILKKIGKVFKNKKFLKQRLRDYSSSILNIQYHYVILQEFIPHSYEWRCVRIGDAFFAHKKIALNQKSSGTLLKGYDDVPHELLDFIKYITDKTGIFSVAIDVFEKNEKYLINEIQCFFGQSDSYQMLVDDRAGKYIFKENAWYFKEGMYNTNESYDLRLEHAIQSKIGNSND